MNKYSATQCRQALQELLEAQIAKVNHVNNDLDALKIAIAQNDIEIINNSLLQTERPIIEIEILENQRKQLLTHYGFESDKDGHNACIAWCDDNDELETQNKCLTDALFRLQHTIRVNDLLVNKGQTRIRRSVSILTGHANTTASETYSKAGLSTTGIDKHSISLA